MNPYLTMQQRLIEGQRTKILSDAHNHATRVYGVAMRITREIEDCRDLKGIRAKFAELAQLLPQYLAPIDDHLKEAEIVGRFAANMVDEEAAR